MGANALRIPAGRKPAYHAAAVFASNFPTVLAAIAAQLLASTGIDEGDAWGAIRALMRGAVANLDGAAAADALTGPIARGDVETVRRHLAALAAEPETRALYAALSLAAVELARRGGTSDDALGRIAGMLEGL